MGGSPKKKPTRPSYEDGKLRDPSIAKMQDPKYQAEDLLTLVKKASHAQPSARTKSSK